MAVLSDLVRSAQTNHLAHRLAYLHLQLFASTHDPHISIPELAQQVQGTLRLLAKGQLESVLFAALLHCLGNIVSYAVETICRTSTIDSLMRTLVVVVLHPVVQALAGIGKRGKHSLAQKFPPNRLPEALDLAQGHRVMRR